MTEESPDQPGAEIRFPPGRYAQMIFHVGSQYGGLTGSMLQRARAMYVHAGVQAPVLTLDFNPDYDGIRRLLRERGDLIDGVDIVNVYEHFRDADPAPRADHLPSPRARAWQRLRWPTTTDVDPQGRPARRAYLRWHRRGLASFDYYRPDGSVYLSEIPVDEASGIPGRVEVWLRDRRSQVVDVLPSRAALWHRFLADLAGGQDLFVVVDSKARLDWLAADRADNVLAFPVIHNVHVLKPRHHHSELSPSRAGIFAAFDRFDGVIILTDWQYRDIAARMGRRSSMFVVPHAVRDLPALPPYADREPQTCVMLTRLRTAKRIDHAIKAFALVLQDVPQARLEIYGHGDQEDRLRRLIGQLGVGEQVRLMGFAADARRRLTEVAASMLSSSYEGQPLAVLESLAAGCPVISYDVKYGPRDMLVSGEHGLLVPDGDVAALAAAIRAVLTEPDLAARMSGAARARAETNFAERGLVQRWSEVFRVAAEARPHRTRLEGMRAALETGNWIGPTFLTSGQVVATGLVPDAAAEDGQVGLRVYDEDSLDFVEVAVDQTRRGPMTFSFSAVLDLHAILEALGGPRQLRVVCCLTWNNCFLEVGLTWSTDAVDATNAAGTAAPALAGEVLIPDRPGGRADPGALSGTPEAARPVRWRRVGLAEGPELRFAVADAAPAAPSAGTGRARQAPVPPAWTAVTD